MTLEHHGVAIEGRVNPFNGEEVILYVENQPKGIVADTIKFLKWPIKLSPEAAVELQKKMSAEEAKELWGE